MADRKHLRPEGRLIAVDGASGYLSTAAAHTLFKLAGAGRRPRGVSLWDASSAFSELRYIDPDVRGLSPRSLVLLYASDLLFRLRWEIQPAVGRGAAVIAAPYVESVVAFGLAAGLDEIWLRTLFDFAPAADRCLRYEWHGAVPRPAIRFLEYMGRALTNDSDAWNQWELHVRFNSHFERLAAQGRSETIGAAAPAGRRRGGAV